MKTKINFTIDSKEITDQINDVITAELKSEVRKLVDKKLDDIISKEVAKVVESVQKTLVDRNAWFQNPFVQTIKSEFTESVKKLANDDTLMMNALIEEKCKQISQEYYKSLSKLKEELKNSMNEKISELAKNQVLKKIFNEDKDAKND